MESKKKSIPKEEKSRIKDSFVLFFPVLLIAGIAVGTTSNVYLSMVALALTIYEFVLLNRYIENIHKTVA